MTKQQKDLCREINVMLRAINGAIEVGWKVGKKSPCQAKLKELIKRSKEELCK